MSEEREQISLTENLTDVMMKMSEGNPGALTVIMKMKDSEDGFMVILHLDDMNIRGSQIWIGFKDHCKEDLTAFMKCVIGRDKDMVEAINESGRRGNHEHLAVTSGASVHGRRELITSL